MRRSKHLLAAAENSEAAALPDATSRISINTHIRPQPWLLYLSPGLVPSPLKLT